MWSYQSIFKDYESVFDTIIVLCIDVQMRFFRAARSFRLFILAIFTVACCLCWPRSPLTIRTPAYANEATQQVQQGVSAYESNQYIEAIAHWKAALSHYSESESQPEAQRDRAIISENLALAHRQIGAPSKALAHWQSATATYTALQDWPKVGRLLTEQAQTYRQLGQPYQAIGLLCTPISQSFQANTSQANQYSTEDCASESSVSLAQRTGDRPAEIAALGSLGETYRAIQRYDLARQVLQAGLTLTATANSPENTYQQALLHNSLGHVFKEQAALSYQQAITAQRGLTGSERRLRAAAQAAADISIAQFTRSQTIAQQLGDATLESKALLGQLTVTFQSGQIESALAIRNQAIALLSQLPPNQEKVQLTLQLTKQQRALATADTSRASRSQCSDIVLDSATEQLLQQGHQLAQTLKNNRLTAFSQGEIGHYYECLGDYENALEWTQQARLAASSDRVLALDTLYLWQWQAGRIYSAQGETDRSIEFYKKAVDNLDRVRAEILSSDRNLQFDFRDAVSPVYRELAEIQLASVPAIGSSESTAFLDPKKQIDQQTDQQTERNQIKAALGNIDSLQLAELQNYFGSDCLVPVASQRLDDLLSANNHEATSAAALISTVIFPDKTAVILTLPDQTPLLHWIALPENTLRESVIAFRNSLEDTANELEGFDTTQSQQLYQQIIAPFQTALTAHSIQTLVFVNDGILRNIPMSALYDGDHYLVEQYALALAPSLQQSAISSTTRQTNTKPSRALLLGLSQNPTVNGQSLGALPAVKREVEEVLSILPASDLLLNEAFTKDNLEGNLSDRAYPIIHIATHGKFESAPNSTFLVTGDKEADTPDDSANRTSTENKLLRLKELDALIRAGTPDETANTAQQQLLDLIVLSACQTASGDERSTLGLAGVTIRAGADTALASLWSVDDESTADLITYFYQNWTNGLSKANALKQAQIAVMKDPRYFQHPAYWSAFMLVGDWQ
ncbi:MAG: CHAT domain-containing protein [Cyanobacteria bacterium J06560_2]